MGALITAEIVVGACLVAAVLCLVLIFVRRRLLERGGDLVLCAVRPDPQGRWRSGLLRFDDSSLSWLPLLGVTLRPAYGWDRRGLELRSPAGPVGSAAQPGLPDPTMVMTVLEGRPGGTGPGTLEMSLSRDGYTALRAWVEAGPPGRRPVEW